jgi:hypothetical protein
MSHVLKLTDEHYHTIERVAATRGQTPDTLIASWIDILDEGPVGTAYETEDWFRHLGMTEEQIQEAHRIASERSQHA